MPARETRVRASTKEIQQREPEIGTGRAISATRTRLINLLIVGIFVANALDIAIDGDHWA